MAVGLLGRDKYHGPSAQRSGAQPVVPTVEFQQDNAPVHGVTVEVAPLAPAAVDHRRSQALWRQRDRPRQIRPQAPQRHLLPAWLQAQVTTAIYGHHHGKRVAPHRFDTSRDQRSLHQRGTRFGTGIASQARIDRA